MLACWEERSLALWEQASFQTLPRTLVWQWMMWSELFEQQVALIQSLIVHAQVATENWRRLLTVSFNASCDPFKLLDHPVSSSTPCQKSFHDWIADSEARFPHQKPTPEGFVILDLEMQTVINLDLVSKILVGYYWARLRDQVSSLLAAKTLRSE